MREINIPLSEILDLVSCSETYGFADDVFLDAMADWIGRELDNEEITQFADKFISESYKAQGYGEEDKKKVIETLKDWKTRYCK